MGGQQSHEKGTTTESIVLAELKKCGLSVSIPFGRPRYDVIVDDMGELFRVQIKTGNFIIEKGVVRFNCRSTHLNSNGYTSKSYEDDIDAFAVYCEEVDEVYWINVEDAGKRSMTLRVKPPSINHPTINYAKNFTLEKQFE